MDKGNAQTPETVYVATGSDLWSSVLLNRTVLGDPDLAGGFAQALYDVWIPACLIGAEQEAPCVTSFMMHRTLPLDDDDVTGKILFF